MSKSQLRQEMRSLMNQNVLDLKKSLNKTSQLLSLISKFLEDKSGIWGAYSALPDEPDLNLVFGKTLPVQWAFPRMQDQDLEFRIPNLEDWETGPFGVRQPNQKAPLVAKRNLEGVFIPALGIDQTGVRLGRCKGFYDRALASYTGIKVGIIWEFQFVAAVPKEAHDLTVDLVITENQIHRIK